jgi:hypothetical protein
MRAERIAPIAYSVRHPEESWLDVALTLQIGGNWGGSFGIALITTVAECHQQFHQTNVGSAITATSQQFAARTHALAIAWSARASTPGCCVSCARCFSCALFWFWCKIEWGSGIMVGMPQFVPVEELFRGRDFSFADPRQQSRKSGGPPWLRRQTTPDRRGKHDRRVPSPRFAPEP